MLVSSNVPAIDLSPERGMRAIAGRDRQDSATLDAPPPAADYARGFGRPLGKIRLGLPREYFFESLDPEVRSRVEAARIWQEPETLE